MNFETGVLYRNMTIETRKAESREIELSFSSEFPVRRGGYFEVLDHTPQSIRTDRMKDGLPVLVGHDMTMPIGRTKSIKFGMDKVGRAIVNLSRSQRGEEALQDVKDGVLKDSSVGYLVHEMTDDGWDIEGVPVYRAIDWEPYEISLLAVGADPSVGVGRSFNENNHITEVKEMIDGHSTVFEMPRKIKPKGQSLGLSDYEKQRFSLMAAVRGLILGDYRNCGFELEISQAMEKLMGRSAAGIFIPYEILTRDMSKGSSAAGGYLVGTDHRADLFIDMLRPKSKCISLGARVLTDLVGDVTIPRLDSGATGYWITEGSDITAESNPTIGQVSMSPKTCGAYVDVTRKLILQSAPAVESMIQQDLLKGLSTELDRVCINGKSANGEPIGILNTPSIGSVTSGGSLTWANIIDLETEVWQHNVEVSTLGFLTHPLVKAILKQTFLNVTYGERPLWSRGEKGDEGIIDEFPACSSTNVPSTLGAGTDAAIIFGNFSDMIIGMWGSGIEVNIDRSAHALSGGARLVALMDVDVCIRHAESFAAAVDVDVS